MGGCRTSRGSSGRWLRRNFANAPDTSPKLSRTAQSWNPYNGHVMESWVVGYEGDADVERHSGAVEEASPAKPLLRIREVSDYI